MSQSKSGKLNGRVTIVTGGGSGIGASAAMLFAKEGAFLLAIVLVFITGAKVAVVDKNAAGASDVARCSSSPLAR